MPRRPSASLSHASRTAGQTLFDDGGVVSEPHELTAQDVVDAYQRCMKTTFEADGIYEFDRWLYQQGFGMMEHGTP